MERRADRADRGVAGSSSLQIGCAPVRTDRFVRPRLLRLAFPPGADHRRVLKNGSFVLLRLQVLSHTTSPDALQEGDGYPLVVPSPILVPTTQNQRKHIPPSPLLRALMMEEIGEICSCTLRPSLGQGSTRRRGRQRESPRPISC